MVIFAGPSDCLHAMCEQIDIFMCKELSTAEHLLASHRSCPVYHGGALTLSWGRVPALDFLPWTFFFLCICVVWLPPSVLIALGYCECMCACVWGCVCVCVVGCPACLFVSLWRTADLNRVDFSRPSLLCLFRNAQLDHEPGRSEIWVLNWQSVQAFPCTGLALEIQESDE